MKKVLQTLLASLARATIKKYKPMVIAITGSVGKTSTRMAIFDMLKSSHHVRTAAKNYNNEIGVALTILGIEYKGKNVIAWIWALKKAGLRILFAARNYPKILVLEYGIDRPGDMDYLLSLARPDIAVVTAIGDVPAHVEFFKDAEGVAGEKAKLVAALGVEGYAILNHDDYAVYDMKEKTKAHVMTYGFEDEAEIKIVNYELRVSKDEEGNEKPDGISFKLEYNGSMVPVRLHGVFGRSACFAAAGASAVGLVLNKNMVEIAEALASYISPPGRLRLLKGIKGSFILDDTYNASPEAMRVALQTLAALPGKRKIAVLGDMLEIGTYTEQAHRAIGDIVAQCVDLLIVVGARAKFIADEAMTRGSERHPRQLHPDQIMRFDDSAEAGRALDPLIQKGDVILVKGSQGMRMEKMVYEIMANPEMAESSLVRQEEYWKKI